VTAECPVIAYRQGRRAPPTSAPRTAWRARCTSMARHLGRCCHRRLRLRRASKQRRVPPRDGCRAHRRARASPFSGHDPLTTIVDTPVGPNLQLVGSDAPLHTRWRRSAASSSISSSMQRRRARCRSRAHRSTSVSVRGSTARASRTWHTRCASCQERVFASGCGGRRAAWSAREHVVCTTTGWAQGPRSMEGYGQLQYCVPVYATFIPCVRRAAARMLGAAGIV
jgi:hypothetical protein